MNIDVPNDSMKNSCTCGICGHQLEHECLENECKCCSNFHIRSGSHNRIMALPPKDGKLP